jgi:putative phosphonate metabolism protein
MRDIRRWAIYLAPKMNGALARFGADWLGWDAQAGLRREGLEAPGLPAPRSEITAAPRRYGFHGTLKAPFALASGREPALLDAEISALARDFQPFELPLALTAIGDFLALAPAAPTPELDRLAAACVTRLDGFRAPASPEEIARRAPERLNPAQRAHLETWGYPYVLDEFRFHMTLTGPLDPADRDATARVLEPLLAGPLARPCPVEGISLFGEHVDGMFHLLKRFPFAGAEGAGAAPR